MNARALSLHGLRGFEAAARLGSLTRAANELALTQSAISRQVKTLEDELGFALFARRAREIELTPAGKEFLRHIQKTLGLLDAATEQLRRQQNPAHIRVTTFASFASLWLIPRVASFRAHMPEIDIEVGASDRVVDLDTEDVDIAIRYATLENAPKHATLLFEEVLFPVVSRQYAANVPKLKTLADLAQHPLIEILRSYGPAEQRATWAAFFVALGEPELPVRTALRFELVAQVLQAAMRGQGVALSTSYGADAVLAGDLVSPLPLRLETGAGVFLLVAERARERPAVIAFSKWIKAEAERFRNELAVWLTQSAERKKGAVKKPR